MKFQSAAFTNLTDLPDELLPKVKSSLQSRVTLHKMGYAIPPTVIVEPQGVNDFFLYQNLHTKIFHLLETIDFHNPSHLEQLSLTIRKLILAQPFPDALFADLCQIVKHFFSHQPITLNEDPYHPAATTKFSLVQGESAIAVALRKAWALNFTPSFLLRLNQTGEFLSLLPLQYLTAFPKAFLTGVLTSSHAYLEQKALIDISFVLGSLASYEEESILPSRLIIDRSSGAIQSYHPIAQPFIFEFDRHLMIKSKRQNSELPKNPFPREVLQTLTQAGIKMHNFFGKPQEIIFQLINERLIFWSCKSYETPLPVSKPVFKPHQLKIIAVGTPSSPGIVSGPFKPLNPAHKEEKINPGDIVYLDVFKSDQLPVLRRAGGLIFKNSSPLSHLSILARELGLPALVSVKFQKTPAPSDIITLDATTGKVFQGGLTHDFVTQVKPPPPQSTPVLPATKVITFYSLGNNYPDADPSSGLYLNGTTLFELNQHLNQSNLQTFFTKLLNQTGERLGFYSLASFAPEDASFLDHFGLNYYLSHEPELAEQITPLLLALKQHPPIDFSLVLPFSRYPKEVHDFKKLLVSLGWQRSSHRKLILSLDTPASVIDLDQFIKAGVDGILINFNHLLPLMLGLNPYDSQINSLLLTPHSFIAVLIQYIFKTVKPLNFPVFAMGFVLDNGLYLDELVHLGVNGIITTGANQSHLYASLTLSETKFINKRQVLPAYGLN